MLATRPIHSVKHAVVKEVNGNFSVSGEIVAGLHVPITSGWFEINSSLVQKRRGVATHGHKA
jgi:hypothetical protein